jgi:hypothetical protein
MYDVRLHVLSAGDKFDLNARRPLGSVTLDRSHKLECKVQSEVLLRS